MVTSVSVGRIALHLSITGVLCCSFVAQGSRTAAAAQETTRSINGHSVSGRFLQVWSSHGSDQSNVYVNGLPITDRRAEISMTDGKTYDTQWFERARYEAHPDKQAPYDVLLGLLGVTLTEGRGEIDPATQKAIDPSDQAFVKIAKPADADGKTKVWFQETGHSVSGKILEYWNRYGGLQQFGFPLSEQFQETSPTDGKQYTVQYFERNRFELHPEKAAPYEVELGLLGVQQYRTQPIPGDQLAVAPPKGVKSTKDTLVFASIDEPPSLALGFGGGNSITWAFSQMLYNGSVEYDDKDNLWPGDLYYVPTIENGGAYFVGQGGDRHLVVKAKIRFGLRWSDGEPITSNDWIFYRKLSLDPKSGLGSNFKISSESNPDANTVIYNYMSYNEAVAWYNKPDQDKDNMATIKRYMDRKMPVTDVLYFQADGSGAPLPEHAMSNIPPDQIVDSDFSRNPVVDGPFKVDHWDAGVQTVLVPNPYYSLTAPPLLKRVVVKYISDVDQIVAQLKVGDLDAAPFLGDASDAPKFDPLTSSGQTVTYTQARTYEHFDINLDRPQFKDRVVRQAMITGINRQGIVDKVFHGKTVVINTLLPPKSWDSLENPTFPEALKSKFPINKYLYDPVKANKMLDDAGWVKGPDGIRAKNGVRMAFEYATTEGSTMRNQVSKMVADDLKNLGMQVTLKYIPAATYFNDEGPLARRQFDLAEYAWILAEDADVTIFESQNIPTPENGYSGDNHPGYRNPRLDELSQLEELQTDRSVRAPMFAELQQILNTDLPSIPLFARAGVAAHKSNLMNWFDSGVTENTPLYRVASMYFK